jgi:hypothetical protein
VDIRLCRLETIIYENVQCIVNIYVWFDRRNDVNAIIEHALRVHERSLLCSLAGLVHILPIVYEKNSSIFKLLETLRN